MGPLRQLVGSYDGMQRMVNVTSGSTTELYTYNADGERVQVSAPSVLRRFVYDGAGRTIGEYGTSAADVKAEHIWLVPEAANDNQAALFDPEVPLAQEPLAVASGTTVTWVHADHLGTPVLLTTATGTHANRYTRAAFGQRLTSAAAAPTTALSFPGQIIDANSTSASRHYNYTRHYDPTLGRYLAADPIGLDGGANAYAYVGGNPVTRVDSRGEFGVPGAIGGAATSFFFQLGVNYIATGDLGKSFRCVDFGDVAVSAVIGAVTPTFIGNVIRGKPGPFGWSRVENAGVAISYLPVGYGIKKAMPPLTIGNDCECQGLNAGGGLASAINNIF